MRPKRKRPPKGYYRNIRMLKRIKKHISKECKKYKFELRDDADMLYVWRLNAINIIERGNYTK